MQMSINKTIPNILISMTKTVGGHSISTKIHYRFYSYAQFCIFVLFTNSCHCLVLSSNPAFMTKPSLVNNQLFKPKETFTFTERVQYFLDYHLRNNICSPTALSLSHPNLISPTLPSSDFIPVSL